MTEDNIRVATFLAMLVVMLTETLSAWMKWKTHWERQAMLPRIEPLEQKVIELEAAMKATQQQPQQQQQ